MRHQNSYFDEQIHVKHTWLLYLQCYKCNLQEINKLKNKAVIILAIGCITSSSVYSYKFVNTLFGNYFYITSYFQLFTWYVSTFFMYSERKVQYDTTKDIDFPYRHPL